MQFADFAQLTSDRVAAIVAEKMAGKLGIGIPFNGTRRWYLATHNKRPDDLYTSDYTYQVRRAIWNILAMMFADGATAIYVPIFGRALAERGEAYIAFAAQAVSVLAEADAARWYAENLIAASFYGETQLLPVEVQERMKSMTEATKAADHYLHYGAFADRPQPDLISRTIQLYDRLGTIPTEEQLAEDYYHGPFIPLRMWIGSDQPTVFDVPLVTREDTALYFLQFPTLYLDQRAWRRLLYDCLFVRGDEEALYPENLTQERHIVGLGVRRDNYWLPSLT